MNRMQWNWQLMLGMVWFGSHCAGAAGTTIERIDYPRGIQAGRTAEVKVFVKEDAAKDWSCEIGGVRKSFAAGVCEWRWTTDESAVGDQPIRITVSDGTSEVSETIQIRVCSKPQPKTPALPKSRPIDLASYVTLSNATTDPALRLLSEGIDPGPRSYRGIRFDLAASARKDIPGWVAVKPAKTIRSHNPADTDETRQIRGDLPASMVISIGEKVPGLIFLYAELGAEEPGQPVVSYRVTYEDGRNVTVPIREGYEVAGTEKDGLTPGLRRAVEAWSGFNGTRSVGLYLMGWDNPRPEVRVQLLEIQAKGKQSVFALLGLNRTESKGAARWTRMMARQEESKPESEANATCNFAVEQGVVSPCLFGTNETELGGKPRDNDAKYQEIMREMDLPMVRAHLGSAMATYFPDATSPHKLSILEKSLKRNSEGRNAKWMICFAYWPKWVDPHKEADRQAYARRCAEMVRYFNKEIHVRVDYWEVYNEAYFRKMDEDRSLWKMYNTVAEAIKKVDPTVKVGGYAPCWPDPSHIEDFLKYCGKNVDFVSWHKYPTGDSSTPTDILLRQTSSFQEHTRVINELIEKYCGDRPVEQGVTEYNINWNWKPHDPRQATGVGAVWAASVLQHFARGGLTFALTWHSKAGGTFGLVSDSNEIRPMMDTLVLFKKYLGGGRMVFSQTDDPMVEVLAVEREGRSALLAINKSAKPRIVKVKFLNSRPSGKESRIYVMTGESKRAEKSVGILAVDADNTTTISLDPISYKIFVNK